MVEVGAEIVLDFAHIVSQDESLNNLETYDQAIQDIISIQQAYDSLFALGCSSVTAINEVKFKELSFAPNPVQDIIKINGTYNTYRIYDSLGRLVKSDQASKLINVDILVPGIYTIHAETDKEVRLGKFIKI